MKFILPLWQAATLSCLCEMEGSLQSSPRSRGTGVVQGATAIAGRLGVNNRGLSWRGQSQLFAGSGD